MKDQKRKKKKPARLKTQKGGLGKSQGQRKNEKKKKKKPARLKTQKGSLGKSQGQRKEEEEKEKIGKFYQVGNLRMQPKKRRILQDESLEV